MRYGVKVLIGKGETLADAEREIENAINVWLAARPWMYDNGVMRWPISFSAVEVSNPLREWLIVATISGPLHDEQSPIAG